MTPLQTRASWGLAVTAIGALAIASTSSAQKAKQPHELMTANTVAYFSQDGSLEHEAAWKKTAAHKALHDSGLMGVVEKLGEFVKEQMPQGPDTKEFEIGMQHVTEHGFSGGIALTDAGIPSATVVFHDAADLTQPFVDLLNTRVGPQVNLELEEKEVSGRTVHVAEIPGSPGVELAIMATDGHMVLSVGVNVGVTGAAVASGEANSLATNAVWKKYNHSTAKSEATAVAWFDMKAVSAAFGSFPIPETNHRLEDFLKALGLHNVETLAFHSGYKGEAIWSEGHVDIDGTRTGLMALGSDKKMTFGDLPPLPVNTNSFTAARLDAAHAWETLVKVARDMTDLGPRTARDQVDGALEQIQRTVGFDPKTDLLEPLGDIACVYTDSNQGLLGLGTGLVVSVDDAPALRGTVNKLIGVIQEAVGPDFGIRRTEKQGRELITFRFAERAEAGALMIDDKWMVVSLMPQTCEALALRLDGKLPGWKPNPEQSAALAAVPREFTSISLGDPRLAWGTLLKLAPAAMVALEVAAKEESIIPKDLLIPIGPADLPPAELVTGPLFPNVTVATVNDDGFSTTSRQSLPGVPLLGGGSDGSTVATTSVLVALLLPAVQQARAAARRTQSKNNLKQLALAMHNHHAATKGFPSGSFPNEKLKPEKCFSWQARLLPYMEQNALYESLDFEESWDDESNSEFVRTNLQVLSNPGMAAAGPGQTHYVGMAGVGEDGPELAANHARAGIFAHNRRTRIRDIRDGTSNTLMISEAKEKLGPWAAGGTSTYRPITTKPYINGPDGLGGPFVGGMNAAFADGSVRFISENIDPKVFEALNTMNGGEVVNGF